MNSDLAIRYRNAHKAFKKPVLSGVDLDIREGEMFALFRTFGYGKERPAQDDDRAGRPGPRRCRGGGEIRLFRRPGGAGGRSQAGGLRVPARGPLRLAERISKRGNGTARGTSRTHRPDRGGQGGPEGARTGQPGPGNGAAAPPFRAVGGHEEARRHRPRHRRASPHPSLGRAHDRPGPGQHPRPSND